tara:strand:- start:194 stop:1204 length:1011 start_codon:yes stop_codon:yes gene_type:complete
MFEYFYNEILRRTIISFGTLFNGITVKQEGGDIRVPLAYGPTQKFLARLTQSPDLNKATAITLPRMSFEFTGLTYDPARKVTTTQQFVVKDPTDGTESKKTYMPVPYNMQFELAIMCKLNDDALQIVEQILPYFQPSYNVTVQLVGSIKEKRDIPIILENITMQDDYEGDFSTRRVLLYTFRFSAKTYMFGPTASATSDIVRNVRVSYLAGTDTTNTERDLTYRVSPRAVKSYDGPVQTTLAEDMTITALDIVVDDSTRLAVDQYIDIDDEEMLIKKIDGNNLVVERGKDSTIAAGHVKGSDIRVINPTVAENVIAQDDNALIEVGDDFGFDGSIS